MTRYRHFDDDIHISHSNSSAILPETEVDDNDQIELNLEPAIRSSKIRCAVRTRLERCLLAVICLLIVGLIFTFIYRRDRILWKSPSSTICLTSPCIHLSSSISSSMNFSVDPCEDFHQFVCGQWIQSHVIPKGHSSWSITRELNEKNSILLKHLLEQPSFDEENLAERQAKIFYRSCFNRTQIELLRLQPLENFFQLHLNWSLKQWIDLDRNQTQTSLFSELTRKLSNHFAFSYLLPVYLAPDEKNSTWYAIHINQPQLVLDSRDYYVNSTNNSQTIVKNQRIREKYREVGADLLRLIGFDNGSAIDLMDEIFQFETDLAEITLPMEILQKPKESYALMTLKQVQDQFQSIGLDMKSYLNEMFNTQLMDDQQIIVLSADLISKLSTILTNYLQNNSRSHVLIDHLLFSLIIDVHSYLSSIFEDVIQPLNKELFGTDSVPDRWEICVKQTDVAFGYALGAMFVKAAFGQSDRNEANAMIANLRQTFAENLLQLSWIDATSKGEAKAKLDKIQEKIGFPDFLLNSSLLNSRYDGSTMIDNEYFLNYLTVAMRERRRRLSRFGQKIDPDDWSMTPRTVNAYYALSLNEMVFPAGILQPPLFHKDFPVAINYGAIGSVIGHEMTHGFDNQGREYDANGNLRSWWTNESSANYERKSRCFIEQYSKFSLDNQNIDGQRTLGENLADNGGLKVAYRAFKKHQQNQTLALPGLNYNGDQLFFIAFAHNWCQIETVSSIHYNLLNDPHSPARFRIIGSLINNDEFSRAFSCSSGRRMNPKNKCDLW